MYSILQNAGEVELDPYPHIVIEKALPDDLYRALDKTRPTWQEIRNVSKATLGHNTRHDMSYNDMFVHCGYLWKEFGAYHTSLAFFAELSALFKQGITPGTIGPRRMGDYDYTLDCQIGINTPVREKGRVRSSHLDNPIQIFGGMLYMPDDEDNAGGDFVIYRLIKDPEIYGKAEIKDHCVEEVKRVPYKANTAIFFLNQENAVHGVTEREVTDKPRKLVNFIVEQKAPRFDYEKWRVEAR